MTDSMEILQAEKKYRQALSDGESLEDLRDSFVEGFQVFAIPGWLTLRLVREFMEMSVINVSRQSCSTRDMAEAQLRTIGGLWEQLKNIRMASIARRECGEDNG